MWASSAVVNVDRSRFPLDQVQAVMTDEVLNDRAGGAWDFLEQEQQAIVARLARAIRRDRNWGTPIGRSMSCLATAQRSVLGPGPPAPY